MSFEAGLWILRGCAIACLIFAVTLLIAGDDDVNWHQAAMFGERIATRCRQARCVIASSGEMRDRLIAAGHAAECLRVIERRVPLPAPRSPKLREEARAALAASNYDLVTAGNAPVALAIGRLDTVHRFGDLVRAWRIVTARRQEAR